jgi:hypothetical protein
MQCVSRVGLKILKRHGSSSVKTEQPRTPPGVDPLISDSKAELRR